MGAAREYSILHLKVFHILALSSKLTNIDNIGKLIVNICCVIRIENSTDAN